MIFCLIFAKYMQTNHWIATVQVEKIYELALEKAGKEPEECIFVDNSVKNLDVAKELGIVPILFNRDCVGYSGKVVNIFPELAVMMDTMKLL